MANALTGTIIAEKYRVGELQRSSSAGDLYEARHILMDKPVSILVLRASSASDQENVDRFFADAKAAAEVSSPYLLSIADFGTDRDGNVYAIYESLSGKTLKSVISEDGAFPVHSSIDIARQIAEALSVVHSRGRIHGNLTAHNVYLTGENGINAKVIGFGGPNALMDERTESSDFAYLAPEQCSGSELADMRGDIYSLGAIVYEMLAGSPPFVGERPTDVMLKHIEEMPAPLSAFRTDVPEHLETMIIKSLSKNAEARQQTAREFIEELEQLNASIPQTESAPQNNLWKTAFIVLVGMSMLAAVLIYGTYTKQTDPATALQPDANGMPVQPIGPATGSEEQNLAAMPALTVDAIANSNVALSSGTLPGGDGYNPWGSGGAPPPGAPYIPPGGQVVTIDPSTGSPFMPTDGGVVLVPVPINANTNTVRPTPTPKPPPANANTAVPQPTPGAANSSVPKPSPSPARTTRPVNRPAANTPESGRSN